MDSSHVLLICDSIFFPLIYISEYVWFFLILHFAFKYFDDGSELRRFHRLQIFLVKKLEKCFILFRHRFLFVWKKNKHTYKHKQTIERIFQKPSVAKRKFKKKLNLCTYFMVWISKLMKAKMFANINRKNELKKNEINWKWNRIYIKIYMNDTELIRY